MRRDSIVIETLKNGILIPIELSKKSAYYSDSKFINSKFIVTNQRLRAGENWVDFPFKEFQ